MTSWPRISTAAYPQRITAVDFKNDGRPELVIVDAESKSLQVAYNNAIHPLGSQSPVIGTVTAVPHYFHVGSRKNASVFDAACPMRQKDERQALPRE